jgi:Spy/CpxP family protein refolding chaperone
MNIYKLIPLALLGAALTVAAPQESREGRMGEVLRVKQAQSYLNLSDAQVASLQQILDRHKAGIEAIQQQIADKQRGQEQAFETGDPLAVGKVFLEVAALRKQIAQEQQALSGQVLGILTNEQRAKVQRLLAAREEMWVLPVLGLDKSGGREIRVQVRR